MTQNARLQPFRLNDQETVWIEVQDLPVAADGGDGLALVARGSAGPARLLREALEQIRPTADTVFAALKELNTPSQIELEFAIGFSGKVGAFIASADTTAGFKVKLTWNNAPPPAA